MNVSPYIVTLSRGEVYFREVGRSFFTIEDIACAGSKIPRFGGHTKKFYSVAEHLCRVSDICAPEDKLWRLLHDAAECLGMMDVPRPLKYCPGMEFFRDCEQKLLAVVAVEFGLPFPVPASVKAADDILFLTEQRDLTNADVGDCGGVCSERMLTNALPEIICPWRPEIAQQEFLTRFYHLQGLSNP